MRERERENKYKANLINRIRSLRSSHLLIRGRFVPYPREAFDYTVRPRLRDRDLIVLLLPDYDKEGLPAIPLGQGDRYDGVL